MTRAILVFLVFFVSLVSTSRAQVYWEKDATYSPFVTWSLSAARDFAWQHFYPQSLYEPGIPGCPKRNGRPQGVNTHIVPYVGAGIYRSAYGGYADFSRCVILIGVGSWNQAHNAERKYWGKWLKMTSFCPLMVHEGAHFYLHDESHHFTPDLSNPSSRYICANKARIRGWNRAFHPGVRY